MIIDQIDAFKTWLTAVLKPMCEADPAALAKYVLALIKKDKSEDELRKSMIGQLDVFLEAETESFVDLVFQTLATKDYINDPVIPNTNPPNPNVGKPTKEPVKETKIIIQPSELPNLNEAVNGNAKKDNEPKRDRELRKNSDAEREVTDRPVRRRSPTRNRTRSHTRSRSRSWDRVKRSRSREKSRERLDRDVHRIEREKRERLDRPRGWRNKSPPRRYDRRRPSRTPSPIRIRSRSRSPRHSHRSRYRNRSSMSRSRSRSMEKRDRRDSGKDKDNGSRAGTPTQDTTELDGRLGTQSVPSVVVPGNKKRCRDFDEKGYCMRGEMCPFDHGIDPVVLEDSALTRVLTYNPNGAPAVVSSAVIPAPVINAPGHPMMGQRMPMPHDNPYNPQAPHIFRDGRFRGPRPMGIARMPMGPFAPQPNINRELIPVPVVDNKQQDSYAPMYNHPPGNFVNNMDHENIYKKKAFDFNRLGSRTKNPQNCSLELKKVPPGMNSITHLNNHFGKFGKIVNIQVQYEGDPESALITFSSHAEANAAYRSTEAVLNNRFIKVFWHNSSQPALGEGKQENVPPMHQRSIKDRLGGASPVAPNTNKVLNLVQPKADDPTAAVDASSEDDKQKTITKEESKQQATEAIKKNQELIATQVKVKKNQDVQRKQVLKIQNDLRKKKQELLDKQISQQKILIEKMEKLPVGPQRDVIKETIKKTQEAIEEIKKDLEATALAAKNAPAKKTKEETQKELLDAELDLIAKQQEGADTSEIVKKLTELKAKIATSAKATRGRGVGRRYTPIVSRHLLSKNNLKPKPNLRINRTSSATSLPTAAAAPVATAFQKHAVDHRPTRLLVSGYETDEQDSVLSHFQQYGEIVDYETDTSLPSITLNYKTRKEAEMALLKGKHFQDRTLSITWSNSKQLNRQRSSGSNRAVLLSENEEEQLIDSSILEGDEDIGPEISEEALLQDDDEEDEEDRSWRR